LKILLSLPEFPFAHHGGAARSMRTICEFLVAAGHEAQCVATTATERICDARDILASLKEHRGGYLHRGVFYRIVETGGGTRNWRNPATEAAFDKAYSAALASFSPDILLTYGGFPTDTARREFAKALGAKIVFGLRNFDYPQVGFFNRMDGVLTCSRFLTDWYRTKIGLDSTPLPVPIWPEDVIANHRNPKFFTAINPARRKGSLLLLTIFRELHKRRPDIPLMIAGESYDREFAELSTYATVIPWQPNPKTIYAETKALLVPSVWEEPAGRVIVEAMMNGIPPIITDRGGMVETANDGAYVIPLDKRITRDFQTAIPLKHAAEWIELITNIYDDNPNASGFCASKWATARASAASKMYLPENLAPRYIDYFERILAGEPVAAEDTKEVPICGALSL
jgi:glycosyltransferase involved in cell wall biosynthesis